MELVSPEARERYDALVGEAARAVVCLDFDGVLAPIVDDPAQAHIHPDAAGVLTGLGRHVRALAVVTGRPVRQAVALGSLEDVGTRVVENHGELLVLGQYGNERWAASTGDVVTPEPPEGLAGFVSALPELLRREGLADAHVEDKRLAVAVHTRRLADPEGALERLTPVLRRAADEHGLALEPGRMVLEVRAPGIDKGHAVRALREELDAGALLYAGDDLGDVEAFKAVAALREEGLPGVLVCSGSEEQQALVELADIVVPGPDGVMALLAQLADDVAAAGS
jgi:trehalose 6-phosphate phosphatase